LRGKNAVVFYLVVLFLSEQAVQAATVWGPGAFFRKLLWLIPYTLAKILLIFAVDWLRKVFCDAARSLKSARQKNLG
jgi:hypothetical protein